MRDILKDIYYGNFTREFRPDEEYRRLQKESDQVWDKAGDILGTKMINELWASQLQMVTLESYRDFLHGIRLGAALMAVLTEEE